MKRTGSMVVFGLCIVVSGLGLMNVAGDNSATEALATETACGGVPKCGVQLTHLERNPIGQSYEFAAHGNRTIRVHCARSLYLVGPYSCTPR